MNEPAVIVADTSAAAEPTVVDDSLAAHEAQFGQTPPATAADPPPPPDAPRHRARSQQAGASDYDAIAKYTKLLRETEDGIDGFTLERHPNESERVFNLRKRVEIAKLAKERRVAEAAPVAVVPVAEPVAQPLKPAAAAPGAFTEPEPTLEQFGDKPDPYFAWQRATAAWDRRKEAHDLAVQAATASQTAIQQQSDAAEQARVQRLVTGYQTRVAAFTKTTPDFQAVVDASSARPVTPLLREALLAADNGPQLVYTLATQPLLHDEAFLFTDGKAITEQAVASTQRWLASKLSAPVVTTGATAGAPILSSTPRPPTPVRTGPIASGDDLPGDESSLAEHEKAFGPRRRRR